jgi:hypothetical protein
MATPVVPNQFAVGKIQLFTNQRQQYLASTQATPRSNASIGDMQVSNHHLARLSKGFRLLMTDGVEKGLVIIGEP